ncbi:hypothetical protein ACUHMQ_05205 [Chitinimonas sp. PSY-7]|uniref:hypothetical protein n=1 Tax=Chitinimonas sp. PSY-7 TaxID=3459088 RepID=UPI0040403E12
MPVTLRSEINLQPVLALSHALKEEAVRNAWRRAMRKTGNWVKTHVAKVLSPELKIPQKVLKQRLYFFLRSKMMEGKVWLGINPIEADRLGQPRQNRTGITAGRHRFEQAWIYQGKQGGQQGKVFRRVGRARTPYTRVHLDIDDAGERAFRAVTAQAEARLLAIFEQELRWEINKVKR